MAAGNTQTFCPRRFVGNPSPGFEPTTKQVTTKLWYISSPGFEPHFLGGAPATWGRFWRWRGGSDRKRASPSSSKKPMPQMIATHWLYLLVRLEESMSSKQRRLKVSLLLLSFTSLTSCLPHALYHPLWFPLSLSVDSPLSACFSFCSLPRRPRSVPTQRCSAGWPPPVTRPRNSRWAKKRGECDGFRSD